MFEKVKKYYDRGFYSKKQVADFVKRGKITPSEYEEITGDPYQ